MLSPFYLFLGKQKFIRIIHDDEAAITTLMDPFEDHLQLTLTGLFSNQFSRYLQEQDETGLQLCRQIERQHPWLAGLSQASLQPDNLTKLLIGDELGLLFIELTNQCNERCIHCYAASSPECQDFLSLESIKRVLLQARSMGRAFVQFTGGDPLIHPHLVEAVAYAKELDFKGVEIYTNGLLLSESLLQELSPLQPVLAFSLYAADGALHDQITQVKGSFGRTVAAMERAQQYGLKIRVGMAVMEVNSGQEQQLLAFVNQSFGDIAVRFDRVHATGRGEQLSELETTAITAQQSHLPPMGTNSPAKVDEERQFSRRKGKLAIAATGDVLPCIFNRSQVLGSIHSQDIASLLSREREYAGNLNPDVERWNRCQKDLSCSDCQMVAYTLGERNG